MAGGAATIGVYNHFWVL